MTGVLIRRGEDTEREDGRVKTEPEIEVMLLQAKGYLQLPEGRCKINDPSLEVPERA